jgi:1-acyl-sn-glycerol-3-phosphate acyltransferase
MKRRLDRPPFSRLPPMEKRNLCPHLFIPYPRRRPIRYSLHYLSKIVFALLSDMTIQGREHLPSNGPLIVAANHFSFVDPPALVRVAPWPMEFLGGAQPAHAPKVSLIVPWLWDYLKVYRGTGATEALKKALSVLNQGGVVATFPEGGNWAEVLRPPRPGTAFLAVLSRAPILPVGLSGFTQIFPALRKGKRARVGIHIGKVIGPFSVSGKGRERRKGLEEIGHTVMKAIAALLPPELRGYYSEDPAVRQAAQGTEIYPWAKKVEGEVKGKIR